MFQVENVNEVLIYASKVFENYVVYENAFAIGNKTFTSWQMLFKTSLFVKYQWDMDRIMIISDFY